MSLKVETSSYTFQTKLKSLEEAVKNRKLINDKLEVVEKGFRWRVLCLLSPFFTLFGWDVYSHVRINNVSKAIFNYCEKNKKWLSESTVTNLDTNVVSKLNGKSKKYKTALETLSSNVSNLLSHRFKSSTWPKNLTDINLTDKQKQDLESILSEATTLLSSNEHTYTLTKEKTPGMGSVRKLLIKKDETVIKEYTLPIAIDIIKKNRLSHIVLIAKKILAQGGERGNIRLCYDLTEGSYLVRKRSISEIEQLLIKTFQQDPKRGVVSFFGERKPIGDAKKQQVLEYFYPDTLGDLIGKTTLDADTKKSLIHDLLSGLNAIHELTINKLSYDNITVPSLKAFHHDLKPDNVVTRFNPITNRLEAAITDFGFACNPVIIAGSIGFKPPETLAFEYKYQPSSKNDCLTATSQEVIDYNLSYGQMQDIWSMGLVLATLLIGSTSKKTAYKGDSPIPCIENRLLTGEKATSGWTMLHPDAEIIHLTQAELDNDLLTLKKDSLKSAKGNEAIQLQRLWDEIVFKMLRVSPEERLSAKEALQTFNTIIST